MAAAALAPLLDWLVFVGGCAAGLLIDDAGATPVRLTLDVDLIAQVTVLARYHELEKEFVRLGFSHDMSADAPICRWVYRGVQVDLMPTDKGVLGFANRWYPLAVQTSGNFRLPSGVVIRLISGPAFLATKFEAFADRGRGDVLASHDMEDIVNVIAGRHRLLDEIEQSPAELRDYLAVRSRELLMTPNLDNYLPGLLRDDSSLPETTDRVLNCLRRIAAA